MNKNVHVNEINELLDLISRNMSNYITTVSKLYEDLNMIKNKKAADPSLIKQTFEKYMEFYNDNSKAYDINDIIQELLYNTAALTTEQKIK